MRNYIGSQKQEFCSHKSKEVLTQELEQVIEQSLEYKMGYPTYDGFHLLAKQPSNGFDFVHKPIYEVVLKLKMEGSQTNIKATVSTYIEQELVAIMMMLVNIIVLALACYHIFVATVFESNRTLLGIGSVTFLFMIGVLAINYHNKKKGMKAVESLMEQVK